MFIDLLGFNHSYMPGINLILPWYTVFITFCMVLFAGVLLKFFASSFKTHWFVAFFCCFLIWFWNQDNAGFIKGLWKISEIV